MTKNNYVRNTTSIKFDNKRDVYNAIKEVTGITVRTANSKKSFEFNGKKVPEYLVSDLEKAGLKIETVFDWSTGDNYNRLDEVKNFFEFDGHVSIWGSGFEIITYQKTKFEHKKEARKFYRAFKEAGYNCSHECETEITSSNCG